MWSLLFAIATLISFVLELLGVGHLNWLVVGFCFVALWLIVNSAYVTNRFGGQ